MAPRVFPSLHTERLVIRPPRSGDGEALWRRRNEAAVAEYQAWSLPFPRDRADEIVAGAVALGGPVADEWWMAIVEDATSGATVGDLALRLTWEGRTAEIGYTLSAEHWGRGYATEAAEALVAWLFDDLGVTRVWGMTHPDNHASNMVLERVGMTFEGHTKGSYWVGDENSDDWIYGMVRAGWEAWRDRPRDPPADICLEQIDAASALTVYKVAPHRSQWRFVAPMEWSFADALFPEVVDGGPMQPWMRAVVADGEIVGFVMLALVTEHHREPYLWRLLIDRRHQRRGIGSRVLELISEQCREWGSETLTTSWGEGKGSPRAFYLSHGFEPTGRIVDDETEARLQL